MDQHQSRAFVGSQVLEHRSSRFQVANKFSGFNTEPSYDLNQKCLRRKWVTWRTRTKMESYYKRSVGCCWDTLDDTM